MRFRRLRLQADEAVHSEERTATIEVDLLELVTLLSAYDSNCSEIADLQVALMRADEELARLRAQHG